jgi:phosphatidylglycerophosphatase A
VNRNNAADEPTVQPPVPWLIKAFASGLFSGYSPVASGTVGSAVAVAIYFLPGFEQPFIILPVGFFVFLAGIHVAHRMEQHYGHDPAEVTIDEIVGMWISLLLLPKSLLVALCAFILFRLFDILKPFPARRFDNARGGIGIMMDDVIAGIYANLLMHLALSIPVVQQFLLERV